MIVPTLCVVAINVSVGRVQPANGAAAGYTRPTH